MSETVAGRKIMEQLLECNQQHLLAFYDELNYGKKSQLIEQINDLDFSAIPGWIKNHVKAYKVLPIPERLDPAPYYPARPTADLKHKYQEAVRCGRQLIADGKVAGFVVAGGQGTRLGFDGPKGDYPITPIRNKTLFRLFAESILATGAKYGACPPWYIMTSPLNHAATVEIFKANDYYGLDRSKVFFFQQGTNPNFSFDGKILMADKGVISTSPDGHGGSLKALYKSGAIDDMKKRGIEYISYWQVDNPLIHVFDPLFIGLHAMDGAEMSSKALIKAHPTEKVGNFCLVDGRVTVIEYSDLSDEQAHRRNADGSLVFELGSIAIHIISRTFVEKLNVEGFALPIHRAVKKIPHIDQAGRQVKPEKPNGIKLETFVFDALPLAERSIILETLREEEFAPIKNATGDDSPEVTRRMMIERAANWLEAAGVKVPRKADGSPDCVLEIAPAFALNREDVAARACDIPVIKPGDRLYLE
jgi:UDP-N-acetylglucosamine/UDP-N-acetylgalactosamine diphosphorylase